MSSATPQSIARNDHLHLQDLCSFRESKAENFMQVSSVSRNVLPQTIVQDFR